MSFDSVPHYENIATCLLIEIVVAVVVYILAPLLPDSDVYLTNI